MRENPDAFKDYYLTKYLLRFISDGVWEDIPLEFRCKVVDREYQETDQMQARHIMSNRGLTLETTIDLDFKENDLILDDLELYPRLQVQNEDETFSHIEQFDENGIKYKNYNRIDRIYKTPNPKYTINDLRFKKNHNRIITLEIG